MVTVPIWILEQVLLMLLMRFVERSVIHNSRVDLRSRIRGDLFGIQCLLDLILDFGCNFLLFVIGTENNTGILRSHIVSLTVQGSRIMKHEEETHQFLKKFRCRFIQLYVQYFDVPSGTAANLTVGRIFHAVGIGIHEPDFGIFNASRELLLKIPDNVLFGSPVLGAR